MAASEKQKRLRREAEAALRRQDPTACTRWEMSAADREFVTLAMQALRGAGLSARIRRPGEGPFDLSETSESRNMLVFVTRESGGSIVVDLRQMLNSGDAAAALAAKVIELTSLLRAERARYQDNVQKFLEFLTVPGKDALDTWLTLQAQPGGAYPVIIGSAKHQQEIRDRVGWFAQDQEQVLALASRTSRAEWESARMQELGWKDNDPQRLGTCLAESSGKHELQGHKSGGQFLQKCVIARLAVDRSWKVPAVLGLGGWNESPAPHIHCFLHKAWEERYGSRIVSFGGDTIECVVTAPPANATEAMQIAWEHYLYAPDIVEQGTDTIGALAESLLHSKYWFFWWD